MNMRQRPLLFILIGLVVSGFFANLGWGYYSKSKAAQSWPAVPGRIVSSAVVKPGRENMYEARVSYDYEVNGQKLRGNQIGFLDGRQSNVGSLESLVEELPVGKEVTVYYNPKVPAEAYLNPSAGMMAYLMMGFGCLGFLLSLKSLVFGTIGRVLRGGSF